MTTTAPENFGLWARQRIRAMQAELQHDDDILDKWAIEGQINQLEIALKWHSIYAAEQQRTSPTEID